MAKYKPSNWGWDDAKKWKIPDGVKGNLTRNPRGTTKEIDILNTGDFGLGRVQLFSEKKNNV